MSIPQKVSAIVGGWTLAAASIGWVVFNFVYVEHGTGILWLAGFGVGLLLGLAHGLVVLVRQGRDITSGASAKKR